MCKLSQSTTSTVAVLQHCTNSIAVVNTCKGLNFHSKNHCSRKEANVHVVKPLGKMFSNAKIFAFQLSEHCKQDKVKFSSARLFQLYTCPRPTLLFYPVFFAVLFMVSLCTWDLKLLMMIMINSWMMPIWASFSLVSSHILVCFILSALFFHKSTKCYIIFLLRNALCWQLIQYVLVVEKSIYCWTVCFFT